MVSAPVHPHSLPLLSLLVIGFASTVITGHGLQSLQPASAQELSQSTKILICHVPPGNPDRAQDIEIGVAAWNTGHDPHRAHALDFLIGPNSPCPPVPGSPTPPVDLTPTLRPE